MKIVSRLPFLAALFCWLPLWSATTFAGGEPIQFSRDVRPILSDKCFACHGPEEKSRQAGLRLDVQDVALGELDSGAIAVVPGAPNKSELIARITSEDPDLRMPPAEGHKSLKPEEIKILRRWIEQGATWQGHWAFVRPTRPEVPAVKQPDRVRNAIDAFVLSRLDRAGMSLSDEADKTTLIRRVTFDLTGLPPTLEEIDAFLADERPDAYERVVERLLASSRYGEHRARYWLDAVRYGDTHGLHLDNYREMWPYRDWVVSALNRNMPYDQFVTEQIAGDLLPEATTDQLIASGYNRCNVTTSEGGSIKEEVYVRNVVDRVTTTGTVFMGLTLECTRCHDHKYDPLTMKDFYSLFAFFNNLDGPALDGNKKDPAPVLRVLSPEAKSEIARLQQEIEQTRGEIAKRLASIDYVEPKTPGEVHPPEPREVVWIDDAPPAGAKLEGDWRFVEAPRPVFQGERASHRTAQGLSQHFFTGATEPLIVAEGDVLFSHVYLDPADPPKEIMLQWNDGSWEHRAYWGGNHIDWGADNSNSRRHRGPLPGTGKWVRLEIPADDVGLPPGASINGWAFTQFDGTVYWDAAGIVTTAQQSNSYDSLLQWEKDQLALKQPTAPAAIAKILKLEPDKRTPEQQGEVEQYFLEHVYTDSRPTFDPLHQRLAKSEKRIEELQQSGPTTLVFRERKDERPAFMLKRGEYDQRGEQVQRATPGFLPSMGADLPRDRLGFAQWLLNPQHPLTSRVMVNRLWQQMFGVGLVKTAEDFGSQGEVPSHPKLLDWLAVQFIEDGWDIKQTVRRMVLSSTYRQASRAMPELLRKDRANRLLARGPRFRLDAEMLRDQALAVSGLLVNEMGGPSVKPPQPDGLWFAVGYSGSNTVRFKQDTGPNKVYRRTLYTFIKRTAPPPQMSTFDAPSRESCTVRRERTNTPLQALLLMNDPQYVEAARAFAERVLREGGDTVAARMQYAFRLATARQAGADELRVLTETYQAHLREYTQDVEAAKKLTAVGETPPGAEHNPSELAAWTMITNLLLNLDETVTKN